MKLSKLQKAELLQKIFFGVLALIFSVILLGFVMTALSRETDKIQKHNKEVESVSTLVNWNDQKY